MSDQWKEKEKQWDFFSTGFKHEYSPRHLYGQDGVDFQERINFEKLREYRLGRFRWAMKKHNLGALLVNMGDNIRYATGTWDYTWKGNNNSRYALVFQEKAPVLFDTVGMNSPYSPNSIVLGLEVVLIRRSLIDMPPKGLSRYAGGTRWIRAICEKENGVDITKEKLGIDSIDIAAFTIGKDLGINILSAGQAVNEARYVKKCGCSLSC